MTEQRPNIVFITLDTWRYDALGVAPDHHWLTKYCLRDRLSTPNLNRFARRCTYFTQAISAAPYTTVSLASIVTGAYPPRHGIRNFFKHRMGSDIVTLPEFLNDLGYHTVTLLEIEGEVEKWSDLMLFQHGVNVLRGFDTVVCDLHELSAVLANTGRPVFVFIHLWDIHAPYMHSLSQPLDGMHKPLQAKLTEFQQTYSVPVPAPNEWSLTSLFNFRDLLQSSIGDPVKAAIEMFAWYLEGVSWFDQWHWRLLEETLQKSGLLQNTVLFLFGDHGESMHLDGPQTTFTHGLSILDDVLRVPLLVYGLPNTTCRVVRDQVSLVDLVPTVMEVLGIPNTEFKAGAEDQIQGCSLIHAAQGERHPSQWAFAEAWRSKGLPPGVTLPDNFKSLGASEQDLILLNLNEQELYQRCVRGSNHKLISHDGEVVMNRFLQALEPGVKGMLKGALQRVYKHWFRKGFPKPINRLFWVNYEEDPEEMHVHSWQPGSGGLIEEMYQALDHLYHNPKEGIPIVLREPEDTMILKRLRALGYIE